MVLIFGMHDAFPQDNPFYYHGLQNGFYPRLSAGGFQSLAPGAEPAQIKKVDLGIQLGTSFSTNFNKGFAFSTMVAPELRYRLNEKFTIRGGVSISNTEYGNTLVYSPYGYNQFSGNISQGLLYVSGDYLISPKLLLTGTAYKEFSINHGTTDDILRPGYDGKGLMMNLRFMPTENVSIDAGIELYEGNNPYRSGMYSPFGSRNPFYPNW